jgi:hypothetical protein
MYWCANVMLWWCFVVMLYCCGDVFLWLSTLSTSQNLPYKGVRLPNFLW